MKGEEARLVGECLRAPCADGLCEADHPRVRLAAGDVKEEVGALLEKVGLRKGGERERERERGGKRRKGE